MTNTGSEPVWVTSGRNRLAKTWAKRSANYWQGKHVSVAETEPLGCLIGRMRQPTEGSAVTYSNQIARLFQDKCVECHRPGRIGPFAMTSYQGVVGWGDMIREVVEQKRMPPWHADSRHGTFANDISLSDAERKLIVAWVENGCPEGDPANLPHPKQYTEGWQIGKPDQILDTGAGSG